MSNPYPPEQGYGPPSGQPQSNTQGLVALILGILSIVPGICCAILGIPLGIAAVILGFLGKQKADQGLASNRSQAQWGLILGAIGAVLSIASIIAGLFIDLPGYNV